MLDIKQHKLLKEVAPARGRGGESDNKKKLNLKKGSPIDSIVKRVRKAHVAPPEYEVGSFRKTLDKKTWTLCVDLFLCHAIDKLKFKKMKGTKLLSEYLTVYDEAFALLTLESNVEAWINEAEGNDKKERNELRLYVKAGKQTKGDFNKMGWTLKGRERYNQICAEVEKNRQANKDTDSVCNRNKTSELEKYYKEKYGDNDERRKV